ncbi:MAG TPA: hypothetical protein VIS48_05230 [Candidatus Kryptonia bacterium]
MTKTLSKSSFGKGCSAKERSELAALGVLRGDLHLSYLTERGHSVKEMRKFADTKLNEEGAPGVRNQVERNLKRVAIVSSLILLLIAGIECRKSPVTPPLPTSCEYPPGNRNFTWRTDTVAWWPSEVGGVWAFSDTDAWVMGNMHGPTVPGQTSYLALHWNGKEWGTPETYSTILHLSNDATGDDHFLVSVGYWAVGDEKVGLAEFDNHTKKWAGYQFQTPGRLYSVWTDGKGYFIAVGDNGTVYTKDGYTASWIYTKAPTDFGLTHVTGVSKTEIYAAGFLSLTTGQEYEQYWKYDGTQWHELFDNQDTTGNIAKLPGDYSVMTDVAAYRCPVSDSLQLYFVGWNSYLLESKGQSLSYSVIDLSTLGLPLHNLRESVVIINLFSPNDVWYLTSEFDFYQWNGEDFQQMAITGIPAARTYTGFVRKMIKTKSGKIFFPCEVSPQVYVVAQGTPN